MPIRSATNYFNNPQFAQAAGNLAELFAPPSGSEAAGWATANAKNAEAKRLADYYTLSQDPNTTHEQQDRLGIGAGVLLPTQSFYSVDQGNATQRYGYDTSAATSRANNAADNARAIETNRVSDLGKFYTTLDPGQVRPAIPASIASQFGAPGALPAEQGNAKPLSETEFDAQQKARLVASGAISERDLIDTIVGARTPVLTVGPAGKPVFTSPGAAVRTGAEPYNPSADKSLVEGTANVGGKVVPVFRKPSDTTYETADGTPLPADTQVFERAKPTGTDEQLGLRLTEASQRAGMFYNRAAMANSMMEKTLTGDPATQSAAYVPSIRDFELMLGGTGDKLPLSITNNLVSPEGRRFYNASMGFMMSVLRPDTGAAFGPKEFQDYAKIFIPLPGDDPRTLGEKALNRSTALAALQGTSSGAADKITQTMIANGVPVPTEMLQHMQAPQRSNEPGGNTPPPAGSTGAAPARPADVIRRWNPQTGELE